MECKITKDKIKEGIVNTVTQLVNESGLFSVDGVKIIPNKPISIENQLDRDALIQEALNYKDEIKGLYKGFVQDATTMEMFLQEASDQYYSTLNERENIITLAGDNIIDIATKLYPQPDRRAIYIINAQFKSPVINKTGENEWSISPSNDLVFQYLLGQSESSEEIMNTLREDYLKKYSSTSLNLSNEELWLNHPSLQDTSSQDLLRFAQKINPNFRIGIVDELNENAVSLIRDNIIFIRQGSIIDDLPEEISHFFFELLPDDNPLKIEMMEKIVDFPIYLKTFRKYRNNQAYQVNGHPDINKIKKEASAKLIGEYIKAAYKEEADEKYGKKRSWLKSIIQRIMKFLRKAFVQNSNPIYTEPDFDIESPFRKAAMEIKDNDITNLNLQKVPSIYDSIFFSKIEDELEEGFEASKTAKSLYEFSRQLKKQIIKTFYTYVQKENLKGMKELLDDPNNKNINRIWDIVSRMEDAGNIFKEMLDTNVVDMISMVRATSSMAEGYREMEQIPVAISQVLKNIKNDGSEEQILDNITELQTYFQFSDTFKKITDEFIQMLTFVKEKYQDVSGNNVYQNMIDKIGATETQFKVVDEQIMKNLQKRIIELTHKWTDEAFKKYRGEVNILHDSLEHHLLKNKVAKLITDKITGLEQIRQAVTGNFPNSKDLTLEDGTKVNIKRIKDMSQIDYVIFMFSSPTLIGDPFISNLMAHFTDKYVASVIKGTRDAKLFADKILPIKKDLADMGMGWYEAEEAIQNIQPFYDESVEDSKVEKRTLLSQTNRFEFQYEKQLKIKNIVQISKDINKLQSEFQDILTSDERKVELKDKLIPEKQKEAEQAREEYDKFLNDWSFRPFTPEYYEKQAKLKDNKADTPALRKWKDINRQLLTLENIQYAAIAAESTLNDSVYDDITQRIAVLQNEKLKLQDEVPQIEKETIALLEELYEVDDVATARLRQRHKNQWVNSFVEGQRARDIKKSDTELREDANNAYEALYTIVVPKQEFYDAREKIFNEINKIAKPSKGLEKLTERLDELREKEKKLLKPFRDMRGEVNVTSFKYLSIEKYGNGVDKLLSQSLKELEEEIDLINNKMRIYSVVLNSPAVGDKEKTQILAYIDLSFMFGKVINNYIKYKPEDVIEVFKDTIDLSTSQAEQILSAIKKAFQGDNSEFNALSNMQLNNVEPSIKSAYSNMKFTSPQEMIDAENAMYGAFKFLTRRERGMMADDLSNLYGELNALYTNTVSLQYYLSLAEFFSYYQKYVEQDSFILPDKDIHEQKFLQIRGIAPHTVTDIENMFSDGVFEAVLLYMEWLEQSELNPKEGYALSDLSIFLQSIHKQKITYIEGEAITTWTPISYVRKPSPDPSLTETKSPKFLTRNRIKDTFRTEKVYEIDEDVVNGNKEANVDINGEWLPLNKSESPFWNKDYERLKSARQDSQDAKLFQLLETMKLEYLKAQVEFLPEGERLDLVIPSKYNDKLEQKKLLITKANEGWKYIRDLTPFGLGKSLKEEEQNYLEEINAVTAQNRDIYTGQIISEKNAKLRSRRRIPINRTSKDATASIAMFYEDVNEYSAKNLVGPIMKSFADVFKHSYEHNPRANKLRSNALDWLYKTKALDEIPDVAANNPNLAKILAVVNKLATFRLLGDPLGALINLTSGTLQQLIEANFSKSEYQMFMRSGWRAKDWLYKYDTDFYKQSNWSLETQLIASFNMIPDNMDISTHLSKQALYANVRSKLMAPRQETEKYMAIHMGLAVIMGEPIVHEGKTVTAVDIYELDPVTNLVRVKNEYKSLEKEWNPVDGTKVVMLRRRLMQRYTMLQGNFFKQNQSFASTTALGKSAEIMKRWFASGIIRHLQGETIDPLIGGTRKGCTLAIMNLISNMFYGLRKGDMKYINEYWTKIAARPSEKVAIRRAAAEFLYTAIFGLLAVFALGYDGGDDDKNKKLREMSYMKQLMLLVTLRVQGELGTFIPVPVWGLGYMEMKRAILDPFGLPKASFDNLIGLGALIFMQVLDGLGLGDYEKFLYYQKGKNYAYNFFGAGAIKDDGDSKLKALIFNTIGYTGYTFEPGEYIKTLTQMQQRIK